MPITIAHPSPFKFVVTVGLDTRQVYPINDSDIVFTYELQDNQKFYTKKLKEKLIFADRPKETLYDFSFFLDYEQSPARHCREFAIEIFEICNGEERSKFIGRFSLNDGEFDQDKCTFSVQPEPNDLLSCIERNANLEVNILKIPNVITTHANLSYNYEWHVCVGTTSANYGASCAGPGSNPSTWSQFHNEVLAWNKPVAGSPCSVVTLYVTVLYREFIVTSCVGGSPNPPINGAGWVLEINNCSGDGTAKWVRNPVPGDVFGINPYVSYGYADATETTDIPPPMAIYQPITISATPASPTIIGYHNVWEYDGGSGFVAKYYFSVPNNPNSTYVWSVINNTATGSVSSGGTTHEALIQITNGAQPTANDLTVRVTETHGNAHVSTKDFLVNVYGLGITSVTELDITIKGPDSVCPNQHAVAYSIPKLPTYFDAPIWTVNNGATILSGQGTNVCVIGAGAANFTITVVFGGNTGHTAPDITRAFIGGSKNVKVSIIPVTPPIDGIFDLYPNEPGITISVPSRPGATYRWKENDSFIDAGSVLNLKNNLTASHCYHVVELINCGCSWIQIDSGGNEGVTPSIWYCPQKNTDVIYDSNRLLIDAIQYILDQMNCSGSTVVSDFFEWNPIGDAPGYVAGINYVTGATNKLTWTTIAQKSDIIFPNDSQAATLGKLTFDKIKTMLREVWNAFYFVDHNNNIRIEHESFFGATSSYDAQSPPNATLNGKKRKWNYVKSDMPKFERFKWEEALYGDFIGADIYYNSICVNQDPKSNVSERGVDFITTDLYYIFQFPTDIDEQGFVLICNRFDGISYYVDSEIGLISGMNLQNGHFTWSNLHFNYHRHGRVLLTGFMNNILTGFFTARRTKSQKEICIQICCGSDFDPYNNEILTELGSGIVKTAEESLKTHIIKSDLLLQ